MFRIALYSLLLLLTCCLNSYCQSEEEKDDCILKLGKSFISDGQDHQLVIQSNKYTKLNVIFLPQFRYRLVICNNNTKTSVEMRLKDDKGIIIYSNNHTQDWDFQFDALLKGTIELRLSDNNSNEESISLIIGYRAMDHKH